MGLGSVAVGAFDDASVSRVLSLPNGLEPVYMVATGYRLMDTNVSTDIHQ